jgi:DMSO/TMAO reductase YedYZ molybdopterin-dependent catalytic subunit
MAAIAAAGLSLVAARRRRSRRTRMMSQKAGIALPPATRAAASLPAGASLPVPGITPLFTAIDDFYDTDISFPFPEIDVDSWRLRIHGMVDRPIELSFADLLGMDLVELDATLVCVHNPPGGPRIGTARWLGVEITQLLERVGVHSEADQLLTRSVDGYTAGLPLRAGDVTRPSYLVVAMNGHPLTHKHGFPARLLTPGLWGADANTKWLVEFELTTWAAARDYWERRGWPRNPPPVLPGSRIDVPHNRAVLPQGPVTVAGVAWAPPRGVKAVEVAVDDGPWMTAALAAETNPLMWRQWMFTWNAIPGEHTLRVRALGRRGVQSSTQRPPYPIGSTGLHHVRVDITDGTPALLRRAISVVPALADNGRARIALAGAAIPAWFPSRGASQ